MLQWMCRYLCNLLLFFARDSMMSYAVLVAVQNSGGDVGLRNEDS